MTFSKYWLQVHDEVKDKMFELELSWVGEFTDGVHKRVPEEVSEWDILTKCICVVLTVDTGI